jgi:hypothetical protein
MHVFQLQLTHFKDVVRHPPHQLPFWKEHDAVDNRLALLKFVRCDNYYCWQHRHSDTTHADIAGASGPFPSPTYVKANPSVFIHICRGITPLLLVIYKATVAPEVRPHYDRNNPLVWDLGK